MEGNNVMRLRSITTILVLACAALSPAFHEKKPAGKAWIPEETEESKASQQIYQGTRAQVGEVPVDTTPEKAPLSMSDPSERAALDAGSQNLDGQQVLQEADRRSHTSEKGPNYGLWAMILGTVGFGSVMAFRQWANKNIPEMPSNKKVTW
jgi:hypothetical protein